MKKLLHPAFLIASIFTSTYGSAATLIPKLDARGITYIEMDGEITQSDPTLLVQVLTASKDKNIKVWGVVLNSPGGNVDAGLRLASIIRENGLSTLVPAEGICASACFYLFAAGVNRWADQGSRVGVHSAAENGIETERAAAATLRFSRVLATLDVPDGILGKIVKTPPKSIYYLTSEDLASMKVQFVPTPATKIQNILAEAGLSELTKRDEAQDRLRARALNDSGLSSLKAKNVDDAIASFTKAATLYPFDAEILGNLGYAQYLNGAYDTAIGTLLSALRVQPDRAMTLQNIGLVYAEMRNIDLSAQYLASYVKASKNTNSALDQLQMWAADGNRPLRARASMQALQTLLTSAK